MVNQKRVSMVKIEFGRSMGKQSLAPDVARCAMGFIRQDKPV